MKLFKHQSIIFALATLCLFASSISLNQAFAVDDDTRFNISVDPTLEITIPDSVNLLINPSVDGTIADTSFDITVGTNNLTGYTLTMYNDSSNLTSTDSSAIIPTLSNEIAKSNFPVNHWGYSLDDNTYKPITTATSGTVLKTTETTSAADTTTINLATKVDLDKPAGTYTNTFVFNVVANELPEPESNSVFSGITTMQQMTSEICAAETTPLPTATISTAVHMDDNTLVPSIQLEDIRDNKLYWVSKLADGNCWMTQNLDFAISTSGTTLKAAESNVLSDKTISAIDNWGDTGFYEGGSGYFSSGTNLAAPITCTSASNDGESCHYHIGDYYSWYVAMADSTNASSTVVEADAPESICPKGWKIPTSNSYTNDYSFGALTNIYSITNNTSGISDTNLLTSPLWFVRGGYYYYGDSYDQELRGYVWSSRELQVNGGAYLLHFSASYVNPSEIYGFNLSDSYNVRCVAE